MYCSKCGKEIKGSAAFCPYCGAKQESVALSETEPNAGDATAPFQFPTGKKLWAIVIAAVAVLLIAVLLIVFVPKRSAHKSYVTNPVYDDQGRRLFDPFELLGEDVYLAELEGDGKTLIYTNNPEFDGELPIGQYYIGSYGKRSMAFFYSQMPGDEASSTGFEFGFEDDVSGISVGDKIILDLELDGYHHEVINRMGYEFANYAKEYKVKKGKFISKKSELPSKAVQAFAEKVSNERVTPRKAYLVMVRGVSFLAIYTENKTEQGYTYSVRVYDQPVAVTRQGKFIDQYGGGYDSKRFESYDEAEAVEYLRSLMSTEGDSVTIEDVSDKLPGGKKSDTESIENSTVAEETTVTKTKLTKTASENKGLIFADSGTRKLTDSDVNTLNSDEAQQAINEIYARNGYKFKNKEVREFFEQYSWYKGTDSDMDSVSEKFNSIEVENIKLLSEHR